MAWIEVHQELWNHPKTRAMANALKINPSYAGGLLCRFWCWAVDAARPDGDISHLTPGDIASATGWTKSPKILFAALTTVYRDPPYECDSAWVDDLGNGKYRIHDWSSYAGKLLERRRKDRLRKSIGNPSEIPEEIQRKSSGSPAEFQRNSRATVPYRTLPYLRR
jgi:hypothetical protein